MGLTWGEQPKQKTDDEYQPPSWEDRCALSRSFWDMNSSIRYARQSNQEEETAVKYGLQEGFSAAYQRRCDSIEEGMKKMKAIEDLLGKYNLKP
jgi:hypothetical protein